MPGDSQGTATPEGTSDSSSHGVLDPAEAGDGILDTSDRGLSDPGSAGDDDEGAEPSDVEADGADADESAGLPPSPPVRVRSCTTTVSFDAEPSAAAVTLAGEWDWSALVPMERSSGTWSVGLDLAAGVYCYQLIVDGEWIRDPANAYEKYCDGGATITLPPRSCGVFVP